MAAQWLRLSTCNWMVVNCPWTILLMLNCFGLWIKTYSKEYISISRDSTPQSSDQLSGIHDWLVTGTINNVPNTKQIIVTFKCLFTSSCWWLRKHVSSHNALQTYHREWALSNQIVTNVPIRWLCNEIKHKVNVIWLEVICLLSMCSLGGLAECFDLCRLLIISLHCYSLQCFIQLVNV